ncbi:hypothetical protein L7F22_049090 [Adiantum nelumboides]|nr:hypothetical protein [Adiantum nelumboides]
MRTSTANHVTITEEVDEQAHIYAALDPRGYNQQFSILEVPGDYEGKPLSFLIDSGSSHSFLSPSTIKRLHLTNNPTGHKLRVSLANGSNITTEEQTVDISFQIDKNPTTQRFRILKLGKFQGILGMDWLSQNDSDINCKRGLVSFITSKGKRVQAQGRNGKAPLRVVKAKNLVKGMRRKGLPICVLKLNKTDLDDSKTEQPEWLNEYKDVVRRFLDEVIVHMYIHMHGSSNKGLPVFQSQVVKWDPRVYRQAVLCIVIYFFTVQCALCNKRENGSAVSVKEKLLGWRLVEKGM